MINSFKILRKWYDKLGWAGPDVLSMSVETKEDKASTIKIKHSPRIVKNGETAISSRSMSSSIKQSNMHVVTRENR